MTTRNELEWNIDVQPVSGGRVTDSCFHRFSRPKSGGAVIKPDFKEIGCGSAGGLAFAFGLLWLIHSDFPVSTLPQALMVLGPLVVTGVGFVILMRAISILVRFDDVSKVIMVRASWSKPTRTISFQDILAVQLCRVGKQRLGHNALSTMVWQLNLISQDRTDKCITLLTCGGEKHLRKIAQSLSGYLGIPLLESDGNQNRIIT